MWEKIAKFTLRNKFTLLAILVAATGLMLYFATKVELSYDLIKAIPVNNPKYKEYLAFKKKFGEDGNLLVVGVTTNNFFDSSFFNGYSRLIADLKKDSAISNIISVNNAINLYRDSVTNQLKTNAVFPSQNNLTQEQILAGQNIFNQLPFYRGLLFNPETKAYLMGIYIKKNLLNSAARTNIVANISKQTLAFGTKHNTTVHLSGLPLIRTVIADRIKAEMKWFLICSLLLSALIMLLFFRSFSSMFLTLAIVFTGVIWSLGFMHLFGFKITLLSALIPPLIVVIGVPNCIYFFNKYHSTYQEKGRKLQALVNMISKMGVVTFFCNLAAATGFAVFALTQSAILKEFGIIAGLSILILFFISLIVIPTFLTFLPSPKEKHLNYLDSKALNNSLKRLERWVLNHRKTILLITAIVVGIAFAGTLRLKSVGYIVDDLPKTDIIYQDLKYFEKNFGGVMPLEIIVKTSSKAGIVRDLKALENIETLSQYIQTIPGLARPLTIAEGLKFVKQAFFYGDSTNYTLPSQFDLPAMMDMLKMKNTEDKSTQNNFTTLLSSFLDSSRKETRLSVNMADVGTQRLPKIVDSIKKMSDSLFSDKKYEVNYTGSSITFLEGSSYIIAGLKESILWAFIFIALCMLYLFRSWRILLCSLIPNVIPLIITAGIMGWFNIPLKPSTVLIFSIALGIAIDITIRFLVNYKQELKHNNYHIKNTVIKTIHHTGISIIYTSLILIVGFVIFCFSGFGGTQALGWLTSLTLITATLTNLILLPVLVMLLLKPKK